MLAGETFITGGHTEMTDTPKPLTAEEIADLHAENERLNNDKQMLSGCLNACRKANLEKAGEIAQLKSQLAAAILNFWHEIKNANLDGTHYLTCHAPTTRTYAPSRYRDARWEYWNEMTGVWERCAKQPTHFISIDPLPKKGCE